MTSVRYVSRRRIVTAPVERIWGVLADYGALHQWADDVTHCEIIRHGADGMIGTVRRVQLGGEAVLETITEATQPKALAYDVTGLPRAMGHVANRWTLTTVDAHRTDVTLTTAVDAGRGLVGEAGQRVVAHVLARRSVGLLAGLARRMECPT